MKRLALLVLCLVACLVACRGDRSTALNRQELARVNDERIYRDELEREMRNQAIENIPAQQDAPGHSLEDRRRLLSTMIDRKLLLQEAARLKVFVPMTQSEKLFDRLKDDFPTDEFNKLLQDRNITPIELKKSLHERLVVSKLLKEQVYDRIYVKDEDISAYYEGHPELSKLGERVQCAQVVQKTEADMAKVRGQILDGMPFEEAATRYSIAPEASKGGDLGWFGRGVMPPVIEDNCFTLKVGELSKVIASDFGFHVFKVRATKPAEVVPLEKLRDQIDQKIRQERSQTDELAFLDGLKKKAQVTVDDGVLAGTQ